MPAKKIGGFTLRNGGGFVCRGKVAYEDEDEQKVVTDDETGDILLGQQAEVDPGSLGVPDGAKMWLYVHVIAGSDSEAFHRYRYEKGNKNKAHYVITGTTLSNYLGLISEGP